MNMRLQDINAGPARVIIKFGAQGEGYWNNDELFIKQVKVVMSIAEF